MHQPISLSCTGKCSQSNGGRWRWAALLTGIFTITNARLACGPPEMVILDSTGHRGQTLCVVFLKRFPSKKRNRSKPLSWFSLACCADCFACCPALMNVMYISKGIDHRPCSWTTSLGSTNSNKGRQVCPGNQKGLIIVFKKNSPLSTNEEYGSFCSILLWWQCPGCDTCVTQHTCNLQDLMQRCPSTWHLRNCKRPSHGVVSFVAIANGHLLPLRDCASNTWDFWWWVHDVRIRLWTCRCTE